MDIDTKQVGNFFNEFKKFIAKGNVMDMAVGVIIGGAFGKIITSLVSDVIMPPIGYLVGGVNFTDLNLKLGDQVTINYGNFLQVTFDFLIVTFCIFLFVKLINNIKRKHEEAAPAPGPTAEEKLLAEIRDLLKKQSEKK